MKDKRVRDMLYHTSDQELRFTEEDRNEVFERIHKLDTTYEKKTSLIAKRIAPLTASLVVAGLCMFLFAPSILPGNNVNEGITSTDNASGLVVQENEVLTTLVTVKDDNNRIPINLLLTYHKEKNILKVLSIPRDTHAPILGTEKTTPYDKLSHAYVNGSGGAEDVRAALSSLFDLPIDYHAVIELETLSTMVDSVNGIEYDLREDIRVRAISKVAFDFQKGTHRLNGEEFVALLMDATVGNALAEEEQLTLINAFINQTMKGLPAAQLKQFTAQIEGDLPIEQLVEDEKEIPSIQLVSLIDGMVGSKIDEAYYIKFKKDFLNSVTEELTTFK